MNKYIFSSILIALISMSAFVSVAHSRQKSHIKDYIPSFYVDSLEKAGTSQLRAAAPVPVPGQVVSSVAQKPQMELPEHLLVPAVLIEYNAALDADGTGELDKFLSGEVSLEKMLGAAAALSPAVRNADFTLKAVEKRYGQAEFLDRLIYGYTAITGSLDISTGPKNNMRMPTMEFPHPGMYALRGAAVARDVEIARLNYEKTLRELFAEIELAFADALYFAEAEIIARKNLSYARDANRAAVTMYETGMAAYSDMVMASIREDELKANAESYAVKKKAALARLSELAGLPPSARLAALSPFPTDAVRVGEEFLAAALSRNSELFIMKKELERMDVMIAMIERKSAADLTLGLSYFSGVNIRPLTAEMADADAVQEIAMPPAPLSSGMGMKSGGMETVSGDMGMNASGPGGVDGMDGMESFPSLPSLNVNRDFAVENAYVAELKEKRKAMAAGIEDMEKRMAADVAGSYANYSAAQNSAAAYKDSILKSTDNGYEAALAEYFSGARDFMTLMGALEMALMKRMELAMFERDMRMELAMLEKMAGGRTASALEGGSK